jgi:acid stress-induced BolA-like protein IbaG/YrbA
MNFKNTMRPEEIKMLIEDNLNAATATVTGADGVHFEAIVVSPDFSEKSRIQKQQLVYAALGDRIANGTIHAISIKTFTPEEWHQQHKEP